MRTTARGFTRIYGRLLIVATVVGISTPLISPASPAAASSLGGYNANAEAASVRIAIYDPAIPIPAEPQVDASIGLARANTSTGPSSRALASYLWPGDAIGDGLGVLAGNEAMDYPVKVNSKYPASDSAPATNAVQLTDGNGMATSANETTTRATVAGLGLGSNLASGTGQGLCALLKQTCPTPEVGMELPPELASAASMEKVKSQSTVELGEDSITATARSTVSGLSLLAGMITVDSIDMTSTARSDGTRATNSAHAKVVGLRVAGHAVDLGDPVSIEGDETPAPNEPIDLADLGIKVEYLTNAGKVDGAVASRGVQGLTITVDVAVLGKVLGGDALSGALAPVIGDIPNLGPLLVGLLRLGSKIVITVGDVRTSVNAAEAYIGPDYAPTDDDFEPSPPGSASVDPDGGFPGLVPGDVVPGVAPPTVTQTPTDLAPVVFQFPGLGRTPSLLILLGLAAAGLFGWLFRAVGAFVMGGDDCQLGLSVGVPNLREG